MKRNLIRISFAAVVAAALFFSVAGSGGAASTAAAARGGQGTTTFTPGPPTVLPNTSGWHCNIDTCIDVIGTGLHVDLFEAIGYVASTSGCGTPFWYDSRGYLAQLGATTCWANGPGTLFGTWPGNRNLPDGDTVCLVWVGSGTPAGNPCVGIHS